MLRLTGVTVGWTPALRDGKALDDLGDTEFFGYGVDAGTGCSKHPQPRRNGSSRPCQVRAGPRVVWISPKALRMPAPDTGVVSGERLSRTRPLSGPETGH
jgi:hypothetical protein